MTRHQRETHLIKPSDSTLLRSTAQHEGFRATPYRCTAGALTVGHGINLDAGISEQESFAIVKVRYAAILNALNARYNWFADLSPNRQRALAEMAYQLGLAGLSRFKRTLWSIDAQRYEEAARGMMRSKWARQTPVRAEHCAALMRAG